MYNKKGPTGKAKMKASKPKNKLMDKKNSLNKETKPMFGKK